MTKEFQNPKHERPLTRRDGRACFGFRASTFICHSSFVIRHSKRVLIAIILLLNASGVSRADATNQATDKPSSLLFDPLPAAEDATPPVVRLRGKDARQQLLVTAQFDSGAARDYTRSVTYSVSPPNVVRIDKSGRAIPLGDGTATVTAKDEDGLTASVTVAVEHFTDDKPINFANQIVPIFTKTGCNAGGCHGKSNGQNGFRLSLLGFEPAEDYEHLVKEARGRRLFPASPENSLLLLKATAALPHGGGKRLDTDSDDYRLIVRWISEGMPYGKSGDPTVARIDGCPKTRTMAFDGEQQLVVMATYTDGSMEDVTRGALYEPNDKEMAKTDESGQVDRKSTRLNSSHLPL